MLAVGSLVTHDFDKFRIRRELRLLLGVSSRLMKGTSIQMENGILNRL